MPARARGLPPPVFIPVPKSPPPKADEEEEPVDFLKAAMVDEEPTPEPPREPTPNPRDDDPNRPRAFKPLPARARHLPPPVFKPVPASPPPTNDEDFDDFLAKSMVDEDRDPNRRDPFDDDDANGQSGETANVQMGDDSSDSDSDSDSDSSTARSADDKGKGQDMDKDIGGSW